MPYGFFPSVDLRGWVVPTGATVVWDHESGGEVVELLAAKALAAAAGSPSRSGNIGGSAALVRTQDALGRGSGLMTTPRGTHALIDAVRVQGVDTTLSQRLGRPDFAAEASRLPTLNMGAGAHLPTSPAGRKAVAAAGKKRVGEAAAGGDSTVLEFPHPSQFIGTSLPILNLQLKNLNQYVSFDVEVEDTRGALFLIQVSNSQSVVRLRLDGCNLPLTLTSGWNRLSLDLAHLTRTCFNTTYLQAHRVRVHASCRLRRVFFSHEPTPDFALPPSLRVFSDQVHAAKRLEDDMRAQQAALEEQQQQQQQQGR